MGWFSKVFDMVKVEFVLELEIMKVRSNEFVNFNFKVILEMCCKFKQYVVKYDLFLKEVFEVVLDFYIEYYF